MKYWDKLLILCITVWLVGSFIADDTHWVAVMHGVGPGARLLLLLGFAVLVVAALAWHDLADVVLRDDG